MPLKNSPSKAAQDFNFHRELEAGKDPKQAYAISKSVQREARKKPKRKR